MEEKREEVGVKEFQQEVKVGWTRGLNGLVEKSKTDTEWEECVKTDLVVCGERWSNG